jgi:hypothetical protein
MEKGGGVTIVLPDREEEREEGKNLFLVSAISLIVFEGSLVLADIKEPQKRRPKKGALPGGSFKVTLYLQEIRYDTPSSSASRSSALLHVVFNFFG